MAFFITIFSAISFAFYPPLAKAFYLEGGNASCFIMVSTIIRTVILFLFTLRSAISVVPHMSEIKIIMNAAVMQAVSIFSILSAVRYLSPPIVITIIFTHTLILLLILVIRGKKKADLVTIISTLFALFGISLVVDVWNVTFETHMLGLVLSLSGALATAIRLYLFQNELESRDPAVLGFQIFFITSFLVLFLGFFEPPVFIFEIPALTYLLLGSLSLAFGTIGMFYANKEIGSFRWSLYLKLEPVCNAAITAIFLNEVLKYSQYLGMLLVVVSLVFYQMYERRNVMTSKSEV